MRSRDAAGFQSLTVLDFEVTDVESRTQSTAGNCRRICHGADKSALGNRSMLFRDPDGNLINFFTPIRATVDHSK